MAPDDRPSRWDELPDEILLQILNCMSRSPRLVVQCSPPAVRMPRLPQPMPPLTPRHRLDLEPYHITRLQLVSRKLQKLCLDDELWKELCFEDSPWYQWLRHRRNLVQATTEADDDVLMSPPDPASDVRDARRWRKLQDMANWDPAYPGERVSWYDEYIQRNGPACINWLQSPRMREGGCEAIIEARGMAMYNPYDGRDGLGTMLAVSPLDDGSVCLWDVKGTRGKQGSIVARSKPDILFFDGPNGQNTRRSKKIDTGVTECVSINNDGHRAFFAVQSREQTPRAHFMSCGLHID